jgi:hypothetical protein
MVMLGIWRPRTMTEKEGYKEPSAIFVNRLVCRGPGIPRPSAWCPIAKTRDTRFDTGIGHFKAGVARWQSADKTLRAIPVVPVSDFKCFRTRSPRYQRPVNCIVTLWELAPISP